MQEKIQKMQEKISKKIKEKIQKILLSFWNKVLFCRMFVLLLESDRQVIQLDKVQ